MVCGVRRRTPDPANLRKSAHEPGRVRMRSEAGALGVQYPTSDLSLAAAADNPLAAAWSDTETGATHSPLAARPRRAWHPWASPRAAVTSTSRCVAQVRSCASAHHRTLQGAFNRRLSMAPREGNSGCRPGRSCRSPASGFGAPGTHGRRHTATRKPAPHAPKCDMSVHSKHTTMMPRPSDAPRTAGRHRHAQANRAPCYWNRH